ncbi:MAG: hypothetical protein K9L21_02705, partial [Spirochaetia bacterium]|nr:hypothetical protein [Spirochaetia bacterium]
DSKLTVYSSSQQGTDARQEAPSKQIWKHVIMQQTDSGEIEACRATSVWGKRENTPETFPTQIKHVQT